MGSKVIYVGNVEADLAGSATFGTNLFRNHVILQANLVQTFLGRAFFGGQGCQVTDPSGCGLVASLEVAT